MAGNDVAQVLAQLEAHHDHIREHFEDLPEIRHWCWTDDFTESAAPPPLARGQPHGQPFTNA